MINEDRMAATKESKTDAIIDLTEVVQVGVVKNKAAGAAAKLGKSLPSIQDSISSDDVLDNMVEEFEKSKLSQESAEDTLKTPPKAASAKLDTNQLDNIIENLDLDGDADSLNDDEGFPDLDEMLDGGTSESNDIDLPDSFGEDEESSFASNNGKEQASDSGDLSDLDLALAQGIDEELSLLAADILDEQPLEDDEQDATITAQSNPAKVASGKPPPSGKAPPDKTAAPAKAAPAKPAPAKAAPEKANASGKAPSAPVAPTQAASQASISKELGAVSSEMASHVEVLQVSIDKLAGQFLSMEAQLKANCTDKLVADTDIAASIDKLAGQFLSVEAQLKANSTEGLAADAETATNIDKLAEQFLSVEAQLKANSTERLAADAETATNIDNRVTSLEARMVRLEDIFAEQTKVEIEKLHQELAGALESIASLEANMERDVTLATAKILKEEIIPFIITNMGQ